MKPSRGSSTVKAVVYDPQAKKLTVAFHSGGTYEYDKVSRQQHEALMTAPSRGAWVHQNLVLKSDVHPATKVEAKKKK